MSVNVTLRVGQLIEYAIQNKLIGDEDSRYILNSLLSALNLTEWEDCALPEEEPSLEEILSDLCDYAVANGLIETDSVVFRDLFDTKLMGILTPRPSEVIRNFTAL